MQIFSPKTHVTCVSLSVEVCQYSVYVAVPEWVCVSVWLIPGASRLLSADHPIISLPAIGCGSLLKATKHLRTSAALAVVLSPARLPCHHVLFVLLKSCSYLVCVR